MHRFVYVEWIDATSTQDSGWKTTSEVIVLTPSVGKFRGWLIHEEDSYAIFATHRIGEGDDLAWDGDICIPKGCITSMREVHEHSPDIGQPAAVPKRGPKPGGNAGKGKVVASRKRTRTPVG